MRVYCIKIQINRYKAENLRKKRRTGHFHWECPLLPEADGHSSPENREPESRKSFVNNGRKPAGFPGKNGHSSEKLRDLEKVGSSR